MQPVLTASLIASPTLRTPPVSSVAFTVSSHRRKGGNMSAPLFKEFFVCLFFLQLNFQCICDLRIRILMGKANKIEVWKGKWHSGGCMNSINKCNANERIHKTEMHTANPSTPGKTKDAPAGHWEERITHRSNAHQLVFPRNRQMT